MSPLRRNALAVIAVLVAVGVAAPAAAAADGTKPTKPGDLRVTAKTSTSVSLAWRASTDNSGQLRYVVHLWQDPATVSLPMSQTTYTWTGLRPGVQYYFWVEAVDPSGNKSTSELAVVTTDRDRSAPSAPANLRITSVSASQIGIAWDASSDDTGIAEYQIAVSPHEGAVTRTGPTSATLVGLAPSTAYSITVRARDFGYNVSAPSDALSATTAASTDTQPPTAPTNLIVTDNSCGEVGLRWTQSTDDQTRSRRSATGSSSTACWIHLARRSAWAARSPTASTGRTRSR